MREGTLCFLFEIFEICEILEIKYVMSNAEKAASFATKLQKFSAYNLLYPIIFRIIMAYSRSDFNR